jgi:hypothetical protein
MYTVVTVVTEGGLGKKRYCRRISMHRSDIMEREREI